MNITLKEELTKQLQARVDASDEFDSVETYVHYVLEEVMKQTGGTDTSSEEAATKGPSTDKDTYSKDQENAVKQRLEDLGYLD